MSNKLLKDFLKASDTVADFKLDLKNRHTTYSPLENDALFHIPFIAMSILILCRDRKFSVTSGNIGQIIGTVFERTFPAFKNSSQMLSWSGNLRARTTKAHIFLEESHLVKTNSSEIELTEEGRKFIGEIVIENSSLGLALRGISRNFRDYSEEKQFKLG